VAWRALDPAGTVSPDLAGKTRILVAYLEAPLGGTVGVVPAPLADRGGAAPVGTGRLGPSPGAGEDGAS
jgi:hypothetical protein